MSLLRAGALVSGLTLAGRGLGYARTVAAAALLGAGGTADAFFVALRLLGLLRAGMAAGGVRGAFVPLVARRLEDGGPEAARRLAGDAFVSVLAALAVVAAIAAFAMPFLVPMAAPGLAADPGRLDLAVTLARVMLPFLVLGGPALVLCAALNGAGRFASAASMAVLFNLSALAGLFALGPLLESPARGIAAGVAAAGAVQLALLVPACRRAGLGLRPRLPRFGPEVRLLFRRAAPAAVSVGAMQAVLLVDLGVATLLGPGAASHLDYAARVSGLGPAVVGAAAATVLLPALARADGRGVERAVNRTLEAVLLLGVPAAAALAVGAEPLADALFRHGAFTQADAVATAQAMTAYAAGPAGLGGGGDARLGAVRPRRAGAGDGRGARRRGGQPGSQPDADGSARPCRDRAGDGGLGVAARGAAAGRAAAQTRVRAGPPPGRPVAGHPGDGGGDGSRCMARARGAGRRLRGRLRRRGAPRGAGGARRGGPCGVRARGDGERGARPARAGLGVEAAMSGGRATAVLVSGGAGYVGSHVAAALAAAGYRVAVLDDLSGGRRDAVPSGVEFIEADAGDGDAVRALAKRRGIRAAVHLAGSPGVDGPADTAWRDAEMSRAFAEACASGGVRRMVLTSSAAVYGAGAGPVGAYGAAKRAAEEAVRNTFTGRGRSHAVLRCFNLAGADPEGRAGPGRGLVAAACEAALGLREDITLFGTRWPTADRSCVRDWVHVLDAAAAHVAALRALEGGAESLTADVGTGRGRSVREALAAVERASGTALRVREGPKRRGDVAVSVAAPERIARLPGWRARGHGLEAAVADALAWLGAEMQGGRGRAARDRAASGARR